MKKVKDLAHNSRNPRSITDAKVAQLGKSMAAFGDISGIVFNRRDGVVYGGTQRTKNLSKTAKVKITKTYAKPTAKGTVAVGYVEHEGERFNYREVDWEPMVAEAAGIAANKSAGEWDKSKLTDSMRRLGSFDVDFDIELTMFSTEEIKKKFSTVTVSEHQRKNGGDEELEDSELCPLPGETYMLGTHTLTVGTGIPSVDPVLKAWKKETGESPVLLNRETSAGPFGSEGPAPLKKSGKTKKTKTVSFESLTAR